MGGRRPNRDRETGSERVICSTFKGGAEQGGAGGANRVPCSTAPPPPLGGVGGGAEHRRGCLLHLGFHVEKEVEQPAASEQAKSQTVVDLAAAEPPRLAACKTTPARRTRKPRRAANA